jgi:hypothetical protein
MTPPASAPTTAPITYLSMRTSSAPSVPPREILRRFPFRVLRASARAFLPPGHAPRNFSTPRAQF